LHQPLIGAFLAQANFESLAIVGRGAFGEVRMVRQKSTGDIWALKCMRKEHMIVKNQVSHVRAERDVMATADNPWIVKLQYTFQDDRFLYMVRPVLILPLADSLPAWLLILCIARLFLGAGYGISSWW
jgi:hypothetical protein